MSLGQTTNKSLYWSAFAILAALCTMSCDVSKSECSVFPSEYNRIRFDPDRVRSNHGPDILLSAEKIISRCYPSNSYLGSDSKIIMIGWKRHTDGKFLLFYEMISVGDIELIFEVDLEGRILRSYHAGTR